MRHTAARRCTRSAATAPPGATLVVFHSAVLAYVHDPAERAAFAATVAGLGAVWVAEEAPGVVAVAPASAPDVERFAGQFLLTLDGGPVAWTDPHGASVDWLA